MKHATFGANNYAWTERCLDYFFKIDNGSFGTDVLDLDEDSIAIHSTWTRSSKFGTLSDHFGLKVDIKVMSMVPVFFLPVFFFV